MGTNHTLDWAAPKAIAARATQLVGLFELLAPRAHHLRRCLFAHGVKTTFHAEAAHMARLRHVAHTLVALHRETPSLRTKDKKVKQFPQNRN